ncbi:pro-adrenomedullin [Clinocottus analis]|uniref:pro-adrenomedullin n=1 Tax=Clinocottus analis TaxID=304258 RepID=UPI0035C0ED14
MRLALHAVICCCVFTAVLPLASGTAGERDAGLKKRFKVWLQSRVKRDLCNRSATADELRSDVHVEPQEDENATSVSPPISCGLLIRSMRSTSTKSSGCKLVTCVYNDLLHRLHQIKQLKPCVPEHKIGSKGYGRRRRRRRSLPDAAAQLALRTERPRRSPEAASKVSSAAEIRENSCRSPAKEAVK